MTLAAELQSESALKSFPSVLPCRLAVLAITLMHVGRPVLVRYSDVISQRLDFVLLHKDFLNHHVFVMEVEMPEIVDLNVQLIVSQRGRAP